MFLVLTVYCCGIPSFVTAAAAAVIVYLLTFATHAARLSICIHDQRNVIVVRSIGRKRSIIDLAIPLFSGKSATLRIGNQPYITPRQKNGCRRF